VSPNLSNTTLLTLSKQPIEKSKWLLIQNLITVIYFNLEFNQSITEYFFFE